MFLIQPDYISIHRAGAKGRGVFAVKTIRKGMVIGDYLGKVIPIVDYETTANPNELYIMSFTDNAFLYPDVTKPGVHLFNHSCMPNCWIYVYRGHTLFFALRDIIPGEELTISYLLSPKDESCNPCTHGCRCESDYCTGTMHLTRAKYVLWQEFQNRMKRKMKMAPFRAGEYLPRLVRYPKRIPIDPIYTKLSQVRE
ncbi:SET domain-containing protein-lysine N-methyltransferase [Candidatus Gottesmanbacteria bacterium]|nr:SET domain-containing protein-lysine N-methyltransferase [Candidatus Gottesmanbacteria bacterium]